MSVAAWVALLILAVSSRPVEVRLWRAGRLSDRSLAVLLLARFPLIVLIASWLGGASLLLTVAIVAVAWVPGLGPTSGRSASSTSSIRSRMPASTLGIHDAH